MFFFHSFPTCYLFIFLSLYIFIYLTTYLIVCPCVRLFVSLFVCLLVCFFFFFSLVLFVYIMTFDVYLFIFCSLSFLFFFHCLIIFSTRAIFYHYYHYYYYYYYYYYCFSFFHSLPCTVFFIQYVKLWQAARKTQTGVKCDGSVTQTMQGRCNTRIEEEWKRLKIVRCDVDVGVGVGWVHVTRVVRGCNGYWMTGISVVREAIMMTGIKLKVRNKNVKLR